MTNYFKRNYDEVIKVISPDIYQSEDLALSGEGIAVLDDVLSSHLNIINNFSSILDVSATPNFIDIQETSGIGKYFVKQNKLSEITTNDFNLQILTPLLQDIGDYESSSAFSSYLVSSLLPSISLNASNLEVLTASAYATTASGTHEYLINALSWLYFLNTSGAVYDGSSIVKDLLLNYTYKGIPITLAECIKALTEFVWKNYSDLSSIEPGIIPTNYLSGTTTYTSGTQSLEKLQTLVDVLYSNLAYTDTDTYVKTAIDNFIDLEVYPNSLESKGPLQKLYKAVGFSFFDIMNDVSELESLTNIERCPDAFLPYLADLIGWRLYTNDPDSWRRQLRSAVSLYKRKGTKQGLEAAIDAVLPANGIDTSSAIKEYYESYIPFMIYYLLKTSSTLFDSFESWTQQKAISLNIGEYDTNSLDNNIRLTIDHILLEAVTKFPSLFSVRGFRFDITNPDFLFNYRGRDFCLPPWEEEKFYKDCDINSDLIRFLKEKLLCLGVQPSDASSFEVFVKENTVSGSVAPDKYNNAFLFFTNDFHLPPNYESAISNLDRDSYDYFTLWNGKSSHFDFTVSSASFDATFFNSSAFNTYDFYDSLRIVDSFIPAKAIARTHVDLSAIDYVSGIDYAFPRVLYHIVDVPVSGAMASYQVCSLDMRDSSLALLGSDYYASYDEDNLTFNHQNLPVFTRDKTEFTNTIFTASGPYTAIAPRTSTRRRDRKHTLLDTGWYHRSGFNQPIFYNTNVSALGEYSFLPLGLIPRTFKYQTISDYNNLPQVYDKCENLESSSNIGGVQTSATFQCRGASSIDISSQHVYVTRDMLDEIMALFFTLKDRSIRLKAQEIYNLNKPLFDVSSSYLNIIDSITSDLWNREEYTLEDLMNTKLGKREFSRTFHGGLHHLFKEYAAYLDYHSVGDSQLNYLEDGGKSIIAHTYGPLFYNGLFSLDGSSVATAPSLSSEYEFQVCSLGQYSTANNASALTVGTVEEVIDPTFFSGVELVDLNKNTTNRFAGFNLQSSRRILGSHDTFVGKNILTMKAREDMPRIRFSTEYGANKLIPEHDFEISVSSQFFKEGTYEYGGGNVNVWLHTKPELNNYGQYVFWNYDPDGVWRERLASTVSAKKGKSFVLDNLVHTFSNSEIKQLDDRVPCYEVNTTKEALLSVQDKHLKVDTLKFNTKNQPIAVSLGYYQVYEQVHRPDQTYILEIFPSLDQDSNKYWLIKGCSTVDKTLHGMTYLKDSATIPDYSFGFSPIATKYSLLNTDGSAIAADTIVYIDPSGNISLNNSSLTLAIKKSDKDLDNSVLYDKARVYTKSFWSDVNTLIPEIAFTGYFKIDSSGSITPSSLTVEGSSLGTNIIKNVSLSPNVSPEELLVVLRYFKEVASDIGSRDATVSESRYGANGGGRLNYRIHPISYQGNNSYQTRNRYNLLDFTN